MIHSEQCVLCVYRCFRSSRLIFWVSSIHSLGNSSRRRFRGFTFQRALDLVNDRYDVVRSRPCVFGSCEFVNNACHTLVTFKTNGHALYLVQINRLWEWISQSLALESDRKSFVVADKVLNCLRVSKRLRIRSVHTFLTFPPFVPPSSMLPKTSFNDSDSITYLYSKN